MSQLQAASSAQLTAKSPNFSISLSCIFFVTLKMHRKLKDFGLQTRTAPAIETLVATDRLQTK